MAQETYNAFAALAKKNDTKVLRIRPSARIEGDGDDAALVISLRLQDLAQARPRTSTQPSLGFALGPVDFSLQDGTPLALYASWVSLTTR